VSLWRTYPPNSNYGSLPALHKAAILDLQWSLVSPHLYTVSADRTIAISDVTTGQRVRKVRNAHAGVINAVDRTVSGGSELIATAGDDYLVRIWDADQKESIADWDIGSPVTCVCWSADGAQVYAGAIDNAIHVCLALFLLS
jgi:Prp8 binding protein